MYRLREEKINFFHFTGKVLNDERQESRQFNNAVLTWIDFRETSSKH